MAIWVSQGFNALSLGSILLLIAIGLTFSFGLMNVINMAHGELIMVGAYVAYVVQRQFESMMGSRFAPVPSFAGNTCRPAPRHRSWAA